MAEPEKLPAASLSQLTIDRSAAPTRRRRRRWVGWLAGALVIAGIAAFLLVPGKTEVQVTSVLSAYPSQQYTQLTASGYVVAQRRASVASKGTGRLIELRVRDSALLQRAEDHLQSRGLKPRLLELEQKESKDVNRAGQLHKALFAVSAPPDLLPAALVSGLNEALGGGEITVREPVTN